MTPDDFERLLTDGKARETFVGTWRNMPPPVDLPSWPDSPSEVGLKRFIKDITRTRNAPPSHVLGNAHHLMVQYCLRERDQLLKAMGSLTFRQIGYIVMMYGIEGGQKQTFKQLAEHFGVSSSTIAKHFNRGIGTLMRNGYFQQLYSRQLLLAESSVVHPNKRSLRDIGVHEDDLPEYYHRNIFTVDQLTALTEREFLALYKKSEQWLAEIHLRRVREQLTTAGLSFRQEDASVE